MWWYILYPLRGTTQPPALPANHPVRRMFYRHGKSAAQHWLVTMLVSVAIAMGFSYPTVFLSENPTAGVAAHPHPVWTTANSFGGDPSQSDLEMRQVWIHGSYMQALEKNVLREALAIQQVLLDDTAPFMPQTGEVQDSGLSWGYHSPLMYWNNSFGDIESDPDVLQTIHTQSRSASSLNVALRPASVFAGKKFERTKLRAADAIVITLVNKLADSAGERWQTQMRSLASGVCSQCTLFPADGDVTRSRVYEFSFTPMSPQENIMLTFAYTCMAVYVLLSLRKMRAFHSRFGLVVTAITQMTCSILSSITICGLLKINLSTIPQNAFPFVVLVMGLEAMFRLINAINKTPATMATDLRIANALGDIGPMSVATAFQNILILTILSRFLSPGVAAFCAFACIASMFDAFFLLTFFVAVLNVDIKRLELQDAISRSNQSRDKTGPMPAHQKSWFDALMSGKLPISTSMAGTLVTSTFVLSLNYHFFQRHEKSGSLRHLLGLVIGAQEDTADFDTFTPPPINATLTPSEWMRMQDFETAREIMQLAKPGGDSFVIRVFAPQIVVLAGSDRTEAPVGVQEWSSALKNFTAHQFYPVAVAIIFIVTFVAVLMNFLLYSEPKGDDEVEDEPRYDAVNIRTIDLPHRLDIIMLVGHDRGHFVSIGLDRSVAISTFDSARSTHSTIGIPPEALATFSWPVHSAVIDQSGEWSAFHGGDDQIKFYNQNSGFQPYSLAYPDDNPPVIFAFTRLTHGDQSHTYFVCLTSGGRAAMCAMDSGKIETFRWFESPLLGACILKLSSHGRKILAMTDRGELSAFEWASGQWTKAMTRAVLAIESSERLGGAVHFHRQEDINCDVVAVTTRRGVTIVDSQSLVPIAQLDMSEDRSPEGQLYFGQATSCTFCGSTAYRSMMLALESQKDSGCRILSIQPRGNADAAFCIRQGSKSCAVLKEAELVEQILPNAGAWYPCHSQGVLGLRKQEEPKANGRKSNSIAGESTLLRNRRHTRQDTTASSKRDAWEAYLFFPDGSLESSPMPTGTDSDSALYVNRAGPAISLDMHTIAIAFGNTVKIIDASRRRQVNS